MRQKLEIGQQITLIYDGNEKQFKIEKLIGDGATCIAYEASHINTNKLTEHYRIKECYPYDADISRNGLEFVWADESEKQKHFERFKSSYLITNQLKYEETIGNNITNAMLCEGNGTVYSVMEVNHASVYRNVEKSSLEQILNTILVLTKVVGNLHKKGFLHLDIKPDNFLVSYEPNINIWLFDVDSLTSITELKAGNIKSTPYSFSYAAPEQKFNDISKISYSTDIFAIGAVLFERIINTGVSVDDMSVFADWNLDNNRMFDGINPKAKRLIKNIFKNTLAVSPKRRYQNTDELVSAIEQALKAVQEKLFIVSNIPVNAAHFIGRETELAAIHNEFKLGQKAVFIHGFGGIGKSTLAIAYANNHKNDYDTTIFLKYKNSLKELLSEINIQNYDDAKSEKLKILPKLLDKNTLLIIDNFDVKIVQDEYLDDLLQFNTNIIFTTRTDFSSVYGDEISQLNLLELPTKELIQLYRTISTDNKSKDDEIIELLSLVESHTYAIELFALQIVASGYSLTELYNKVSDGLYGLSNSEKIKTRKDGKIKESTVTEIISVLFDVLNLNELQKQVLRNLYLLSPYYIDKSKYREIASATSDEVNNLNTLVEIGWVKQYNNYFQLHSIVFDVIGEKLNPAVNNCVNVSKYFATYKQSDEQMLYEDKTYGSYGVLEHIGGAVSSFITLLTLSNPYNYEFVSIILKRFGFLATMSNKGIMNMLDVQTALLLSDEILFIQNSKSVYKKIDFDISLNMFRYWIEHRFILETTGSEKDIRRKKYQNAFFKKLLYISNALNISVRDNINLENLFIYHDQDTFLESGIDYEVVCLLYDMFSTDKVFEDAEVIKRYYLGPYNDNINFPKFSLDELSLKEKHKKYEHYEFPHWRYYCSKIWETSESRLSIVNQLLSSKDLTFEEKRSCLLECILYNIFSEIRSHDSTFNRNNADVFNKTWDELSKIIDIAVNISSKIQPVNARIKSNIIENKSLNYYYAVLKLALGTKNDLFAVMDKISYEKIILSRTEDGKTNYRLSFEISSLIMEWFSLGRASWILEYIDLLINKSKILSLPRYTKCINTNALSNYYELFLRMRSFAERSCIRYQTGSDEHNICLALKNKYDNILKFISGEELQIK